MRTISTLKTTVDFSSFAVAFGNFGFKYFNHKRLILFLISLSIGFSSTWAQPTITSFTPLSGVVGSTVTINGTNFNTTPANNIVFFGATKATVSASSATSVTVSVPTGATYTPITVLNTGTGLAANSLSNFTPTFSPVKTTITTADFAASVDFTTANGPVQVAIGDIDGDGKSDLVTADYGSALVSVHRNISNSGSIGSGSFQPKISFAGGSGVRGVAIGDINGDGKPDLAVSNIWSHDVSIFRNTSTIGNISFVRLDISLGAGAYKIAIVDIDGDGKPDLVTANTDSYNVSVSRNTFTTSGGAASFAAQVSFPTGSGQNFSVAIGDLDGDGKPDLVTTTRTVDVISILHNTSSSGSISFATKIEFPTGSDPRSVAIGDLDGDGKPDLAVAHNSALVSVYQNTSTSGSIGSGNFANRVDFSTVTASFFVTIGDLDGDGKPDLALARNSANRVSVMRNTTTSGSFNTGSFATPVDFITPGGSTGDPYSVAIGDLDGDSRPELVVSNQGLAKVSVFRNILPPPTPPTITLFTPISAKPGDVVTINGTNFNTTPTNNIVFFGATKATVSASTATSITVTVPVGATYAPITLLNTGTGLAAFSLSSFTPTFSPAKTTITTDDFAAKVDITTGTTPYSVGIGDLDGDGKADLVVANFNSNTVSIHRNISTSGSIGSGSFATKVDFATGSNPYSVAIGDIDGDGKVDIVIANVVSSTVSVLRNTSTSGTISFATKQDFTTGTNPYSVAIRDLDGDGKSDLAVANQSSQTVSVLRNTSTIGSIGFATKIDFGTGYGPWSVAIGDIDGDGKPDLAVANDYFSTVSILRNTSTIGSINFDTKVDFPTGGRPWSVAIGDIDGDGKLDLAVQGLISGIVSVYRNTSSIGSIGFATKVDFATGAQPTAVAMGDVNGDGKLDMVVANENQLTVSVFRNTSTSGSINAGSFAAGVEFAAGGNPNTISIGDLDGDGMPDLVVANPNSNSFSVLRNVVPSPPTISINGTPTSFAACTGTASAAQSISVSGNSLTSNLTITAPTGFEISLTSGGTYSNSLNITPSAGTVASTSVFVRMSNTATGIPTGNISVASTGGPTQNIAVGGTINPLPTSTITTSGPTTFCAGGSVNLSATGNALTLGGGRYVSVPHSSLNSLGSGTTYTIEAWIKVADGANNTIVDKGNYNFLFMTHPNEQTGLGLYNRSFGWIYSAGVVPVNQWVHVAVTYANRTVKFYQNSILQGTYTASTNSTGDNGPLNIGRQDPTGCQCNIFDGSMDELRMWNVVKSQAELLASMNATIPSNSSGLVAYYKFDEGTGSSITDATSNLNNGSMIGTPIWQVPSTSPLNGSNSSYLWSPGGATTQSITANTSGNYTLTVTNQNGCSATSAATTVTVNPLPTISAITGTTSICSGASTNLTATSAAVSPIFKWYSALTGGTLLFTGATFTTPNLVNNTTYYVEVSNANACASAARTAVSVAVTNINNQTVSLSSSPICGSGVATVSLASSQAGINYTLRNNANNVIVAGPIQGNGGPLNFNTGTISSTTTYNVLAQTAGTGAITFNGSNQYVKAPLNGSQLSSFTIEMWVNPNTGANSGIFQWANGVGTGVPYVYWYYSGATLSMYINGNYYIATNVPTGAWSHIALTFNGSLWSLYKNGALQATYAGGSNKSSYPPDDLYFGNGYHGYYNGSIDDARIWSVVRTQAEIQGAMSACLTGSENGLLANYKFDDGAGLTAVDSKGGINGTLTNMSASTAWVAGNINCGSQASCSLQMSNTVTATINPLPTATISGNTTICQNATSPNITFTGANATAPYTFTYTINGGAPQTVTSVGNIATVSVPSGATGTFTYALVSVKEASSTQCSNTAAGSAVLTVNSAPVFSVSSGNQTATNSTGLNSAIVSYNATVTASPYATLSYTFSGATTGSGTGTGSGQIFNIGVTNVVITATNTCGSVTNSFTVLVNDIIPPSINTVTNISTNATSANGAVVNYTAPIGTDNVGGATTVQTAGFPSGSIFPLGTTTNTFVVTDGAGLTATSSFTVTITGIAPVLATPANISVNNAPGVCGANVTYTATQSTVGIPASTITYSIEPGSLFAVGTTTVTVTATNAVGSSSKTFTVTMVDNTNPVLSAAPANVTVECDAVPAAAVLTATDNCSAVVTMTETRTAGINANNYTLTRVWTATDPSNNSVSATQVITVRDSKAPSITAVANQTFCANISGNTYTIPSISATDNCSGVTIGYSITGATTRTGLGANASGIFNIGTSMITYTVTDASGNSSTSVTLVKINPLPVATITTSSADAFCNKLDLTANSASRYEWIYNNSPAASAQTYSLGITSMEGVYSLFITDANGCRNATAATYNYQKQNVISNYTILAYKKVELGKYNKVTSGSVGVMTISGKAEFEKYSSVNGSGSFVKAPKIEKDGSSVNITTSILGVATVTLPAMQYNMAITRYLPNLNTVQNSTVTLNGNYNNLTIKKGTTATLSGNTFGTIKVEDGASIRFTQSLLFIDNLSVDKGMKNAKGSYVRFAPNTTVRVSTRVSIGSRVTLNEERYKVTFYMGDLRCDDEKFKVYGNDINITANIIMPNGKLKVQSNESNDDRDNCDHRVHALRDCRHRNHDHNDCDHRGHDERACGDNIIMTGLFIAEEVESKGNTVIWRNFDCSASSVTTNSSNSSMAFDKFDKLETAESEELTVTVMPNPSTTYFTIKLSSKSTSPVNIKVMDASGRAIESKPKVATNSTIQLGFDYASGTYFMELIQNNRRKVVQLIKGRG